jgi:hypothetical protein
VQVFISTWVLALPHSSASALALISNAAPAIKALFMFLSV